jgi:hypothetical protein
MIKGRLIRGIRIDKGHPKISFNNMEMPVTPPSIKLLERR